MSEEKNTAFDYKAYQREYHRKHRDKYRISENIRYLCRMGVLRKEGDYYVFVAIPNE